MELRYAGFLSLIVIVALVISKAAARPLAGSGPDVSALTTTSVNTLADPSSKVHDQSSGTTRAGADFFHDEEVSVVDELTGQDLQDNGWPHEARMLVATTQDYNDPVSNENPKHNP